MRTTLVAALAVATLALGMAGASAYWSRQAALASAAQAAQQQRAEAAAAAWVEFVSLAAADPRADLVAHSTEFAAARTSADFDLLRDRWSLETDTARLELAYLSETSGGLEDGVPHDVAALGRSIAAAARDAAGAGITTEPAAYLAQALAAYVRLPAPERVAQHESVRGLLDAGLKTLSTRVAARREATDLASRVDDLLGLAGTVGIPAGLDRQVADAKALSARATSDEDVRAADLQLRSLTSALNAIINRSDSAALPPCLASQPSHLIWIHLATQQLVAYQDGCPWLATPVTTGRPALPTDRGTYSIFYKTPAYHMVSPWPLGSVFYYPPTWVYYAMEFVGDGTFIHNADWQPDETYGQGSQYGPYASHGCVHVRDRVLPSLYAWAPVGTTVVVSD